MFAVVVTPGTSNFLADQPAIIIYGSGFDPIVSNNTLQFNEGAVGTVVAATETSLTVEFSTPPEAGSLTAVVISDTENSGTAVQVATVVPVITSSTAGISANATELTILGTGFDDTVGNNSVTFSNGAVGTVTASTRTSLTVSIDTAPSVAGSLTATVTTNGVSSDTIQVATVVPVITVATSDLAADATTLTINGSGFGSVAGDVSVTLSNGAVGTVSAATPTSLTIDLDTPPTTAGNLLAFVTVGGINSDGQVQVATITPVVTTSNANQPASVSTITINGFGFDPIASNNTVSFNNGALGTVTAASSTTLTISFSTRPTTAGSLTAVVTTRGVSSGTPIEIAEISPVVTSRNTRIAADETTVTINGFGFSSTPGDNTVTFTNGAIGDVTNASPTSLTVTLTTPPTSAGSLMALVTTLTVGSGSSVQVATVAPVITSSTDDLAADATTVLINGFGFAADPLDNSIVFNNGAVGSVTAASPTEITVTFSTRPTRAGSLTAVITSNGVVSGSAVQVATVTPVVSTGATNIAANASTMTIAGFGFSEIPGNNVVSFNNGAVGVVTAATATSLTVSFTTRPTTAGDLEASVTSNGVSSGTAVQVATVIPVVTASNSRLAADALVVVISGFGFDPTPGNNTVQFNNGAVGNVTIASPTSLTVEFTTNPTSAGSLTAIVTTNSLASVSAVEIATVVPVITSSIANLGADETTLVIDGFGFASDPADNTILFDNGAIGTVTAATPTSLTVSFATRPVTAGGLTARVTSNTVAASAAVQVATVIPVVTTATASLSASSTTVVINGFGFDSIAADNVVTLDNGAVGSVTAATPTQLTVTFSVRPTTAGVLSATVVTDSVSSGALVQIATVVPSVTASTTTFVSANQSTITINGFGFSSTPGDNTVVFNSGAVGTVTAATNTTLEVTFSTRPRATDTFTAIVTTDSHSSGAAVQIAAVRPVVLANAAYTQNASITTLLLVGVGFDSTPENNVVAFNRGAVGTVTAATATTLTVNLTTLPTGGSLTAVVTTNGVSNGATVQVATIRPLVSNSTASLAANATSITINGFGFDPTASANQVTFNNGAVGTVATATATSLVVNLTTRPTSAGPLTAVVTNNGVASGAAVQVATVAPVVTSTTTNRAADATTIIINGFGFSSVLGNNTVTFNRDAVGTVTAASPTSLTVTFSRRPSSAGSLTASVSSNGISSGAAVSVGTIAPVVTANNAYQVAANANTLVISGRGFDPIASNNVVTLSNGAVANVALASETQLTLNLTTPPTSAGALNATVVTNGISSGAPVLVATIRPVVSVSSTTLAANGNTLTIGGFGFSTTPGSNTVVFDNGAVGAVTASTSTSLTVTLSTRPTVATDLSAVVTSNLVSSGAPVQVASVIPVVTSSEAVLAANANSIIINGFGFNAVPGDNLVTLSSGAAGVVTDSSATSLTVTFTTRPTSSGELTAVVSTNSKSSGAPVQVAAVIPVVTTSTANLDANQSSMVINGFGFSSTPSENVVTFNNGAVGSVTAASPNSLTVTFDTNPVSAGALSATVVVDGVSTASSTQVATVRPVVTSIVDDVSADSDTITIAGFGFDPDPANNSVVFNNGAAGNVTEATATELTVLLTSLPTSAGSLTAVVTSNGVSSGSATQAATVVPVVTESTANLAANGNTVLIQGVGFSATPGNNLVTFNNGAVGNVTSASTTSLTVTFTTRPVAGGVLTAVVNSNGVSSGNPVQIAEVSPVVTANAALRIGANATTVTITGIGFSATPSSNTVALSSGALGTVTASSATSLTVTFDTPPQTAGPLTVVVTTNDIESTSPVTIATVAPVVTVNTTTQGANADTVTIAGFGFDPIAANNAVTFSNGAVGAVTSATETSLTVTFSTKPTSVGNLTAVVTTNSVSSGSAIQVATVVPVVTANVSTHAISANTITITGFGFDSLPANNLITFNRGAVGTVTNASATSLTVTFTVKPTSPGNLTAIVTTNSRPSGSAVQVASVIPVVTLASSNLAANASSVTIHGFGFDTTPENNVVTFSSGAVGTVSSATATTLTVDLSSQPTAGDLTAVVAVNGIINGSPVKVATTTPVADVTTVSLAADANQLTILGTGFDIIASNNTVTFNRGAAGTVVSSTPTSLTVVLSALPTSAGSLTATVTSNGNASGTAVQVANVTPVVTSSEAVLAIDASTILIDGVGFDSTAENNVVAFNRGAAGTVTSATATRLTISITSPPTSAGALTASVTSNSLSSGAAVQVASVIPALTSSTTQIGADAASITIAGSGFDTTAANNRVVFSSGAVGVVTAATTTELTVMFAIKPKAGSLEATVIVNGISSDAEQVAVVRPVVTSSNATLAASSTRVNLSGFGFDPIAANNTVVFDNGAVGTVAAATPTSLIVNLTARATAVANLNAVVTSNGVSSGAQVQVASVLPAVTRSTANVAPTESSIVINGFAFNPTPSNNTVVFNNGAVGTVTGATATTLTVSLDTPPSAGILTATVTSSGASSGLPVQVANVVPTVTTRTDLVSPQASSITIVGTGFSPIAANNTVTLSSGAVGTVRSASSTTLVVSLSSKASAGNLTATVRTNGINSASTQVATVNPLVTTSTSRLSLNGTRLLIRGAGFDSTPANNLVVLSRGAVGTVTESTHSTLVVTLTTRPTTIGPLTAVVTSNGRTSGAAVQVADVVANAVAPVVTRSTTTRSSNATSITINGTGFSPIATNNVVTFNNGVAGIVTSATATSLNVNLLSNPIAGTLTAVVSTNGIVSGSPVQVATVVPVVTTSTQLLAASASTMTINGFGFDPNAANNLVTFNNGAIGTVVSATPTSLNVRFTTRPVTSANLTAIVTTNDRASVAATQVANVLPVVTSTTTSVGINESSIVINGFGFSPTAVNNSVVLSNGAAGTVASATATRLVVSLSSPPDELGDITAVVTANTRSSGDPVRVATVRPVVTGSVSSLAANASILTINGFGFDPIAANNVVSFNSGAVGVVTAATTTSLTVSFATRPEAGALRASVTTSGFSSGTSVQVASVTPVITASTSSTAANLASMTFHGFGFSSIAANNTVTFNGDVTGTVSDSTPTSLTINFVRRPLNTGALTAVVSTNSTSSGAAVQIANITPVISTRTLPVPADTSTLVIRGFGFDTTAANNTVTFDNGVTGTVTSATATSLTVTLSAPPTKAGVLRAQVTVGGLTSQMTQVATIRPVVTASTANLALNSSTMVINGLGFDTIASNNTVVFNNGATGTVISSTPTSLLVDFDDLPPAGILTAIVTSNGLNSGAAVQVATVNASVTLSTASLAADASGITIVGDGFDPIAANNSVSFNRGAVGTVTSATATSLSITFSTLPTSSGSLTAVVTTNGATSGSPAQVATIRPVVRNTSSSVDINATTLLVSGFGFGSDAAGNQVVLSNGAVGTVTAATPTRLTVTLSAPPTTVGPLTAVVTSNSVSSGAPVEFATVRPVVTVSTANRLLSANTLEIIGAGFSSTAANNTVTFNNGAIGTVTSATATSLLVTFSTRPVAAGLLTALVETNGVSARGAVQVATMI